MRYRLNMFMVVLLLSVAAVMLGAAPAAAGEIRVYDQRLPFQIAGAPAVGLVGPLEFQAQLQVVRSADNRIFYAVSHPGKPDLQIRGWSEIPGGGRTEHQLAVH